MSESDWTPQEAYCAFACMAIETDGSVGAEEHEALMAYLKRSEVLADHSSDLAGLIKSVHHRIAALGEMGMLEEAAKSLPEHLKEPTFKAAVDLTWSDDDSDPGEAEFITSSAAMLGITQARRDVLVSAAARD